MQKISLALRSRTTWTIVVIFIINGVQGIREFIPPGLLTFVDLALSYAAVYFRVNRKADAE